jgi:long-chain acyl-CoA synthetase
MEELVSHPDVRALIDPLIAELNRDLARHETIKNYAILPRDLSQEAGDLTPTLKVKRRVVEAKNQALLDGFYEGAIASV